jgi:Flp pilus assembly protein TadG
MNGLKRWWMSDRGSATAEVTLIAPLLVMLLLFVAVLLHRGVTARLRLDDVAHQAARAASLERDAQPASRNAHSTATAALSDAGVSCASFDVATSSEIVPGGSVHVTVTCVVDLGDALLLGLPGTTTLSATATEPIDSWRSGEPTDAHH